MIFLFPQAYIAAVVLVLLVTLYITVRTEGWLPPFRMLRIRRVLVLGLLLWGLFILTAPARAAPSPTPPVVYRWDQPASTRVCIPRKTPASGHVDSVRGTVITRLKNHAIRSDR